MGPKNLIYQMKITLNEITPSIWRRIQIPATYSFWDLHVAIQDAMGWLDYHLHVFRLQQKHKRKPLEIGIPDEEFNDDVLPGWKTKVSDYLSKPGDSANYDYDFGDGWEHDILLEGVLLKEPEEKYPKCIDGGRACPPEDCGGVGGYYDLLQILSEPKNPEYRGTIEWLQSHAENYYPYKPDHFDPQDVHFGDPKERLKMAGLR